MLDFSWDRDVQISVSKLDRGGVAFFSDGGIHLQTVKIDWKEPEKALTKMYPRETGEDEDEIADPGSFFNFFEHEADPSEVSLDRHILKETLMIRVSCRLALSLRTKSSRKRLSHFLGNVDGDVTDSEEEDDDDDDAEEIDLEKPRPKKPKV